MKFWISSFFTAKVVMIFRSASGPPPPPPGPAGTNKRGAAASPLRPARRARREV